MPGTSSSERIPQADLAFIGGSGTFDIDFPADLGLGDVDVLEKNLVFATPFGPSPPLNYLLLPRGRKVITCRMHGWRPGVSRRAASQQIFWAFREAGVKRILAEGGVGTVHPDSRPGELVIPDDYIDLSCRRDTSLTDDYLLIMRDPFCPVLREVLAESAGRLQTSGKVTTEGVYAVTDGRHFESRAEVRALAAMGADVIGQSLAPEVYLAREIGACYAGIHQIVNRAEGIGGDWSHEELSGIFHRRSSFMGSLAVEALKAVPLQIDCGCRDLRKETLLRFPDQAGPP